MSRALLYLISGMFGFALAGCASFINDDIHVSEKEKVNANALKARSLASIRIAGYVDGRNTGNPRKIGINEERVFGAVADLKQALKTLNRVAKDLYPRAVRNEALERDIAKVRAEFKASNRAMEESDDFPMMPERILAEVRAALPRDAIITTDVGWNKNGVGQQFPIFTPGSFITPGGYATMGFGPSAAIGAKIAAPDRLVVSLVGDGGFGQNPASLATAVEENLAVVWVVMNNNAFGTIAGLQKAHFGLTYGTVFPGAGPEFMPDYAAIARAYGVEGVRIHKASEFKPALMKAIKSAKPCLIDVAMRNNPTPTAGHWNILDIYSPGKKVSHAATD